MNQVHKETLTQVENALPNRQGLDVEIFGMEGIPQDILEQHRNRIIQTFYQEQEDRRIATGNPTPGQSGKPQKKIKIETAEELKKRLAEWRAKRAAEKAAGTSGSPSNGAASAAPGAYVSCWHHTSDAAQHEANFFSFYRLNLIPQVNNNIPQRDSTELQAPLTHSPDILEVILRHRFQLGRPEHLPLLRVSPNARPTPEVTGVVLGHHLRAIPALPLR